MYRFLCRICVKCRFRISDKDSRPFIILEVYKAEQVMIKGKDAVSGKKRVIYYLYRNKMGPYLIYIRV